MDFETRNINSDQEARKDLVEKYRSRSTPTVVWGDEVIEGFQKDRLQDLIDSE